MKKEYSWHEYQDLIFQLIEKVKSSHNEYDQVLCLARVGLLVGDAFNRALKLPLAVLFTSSYKLNKQRGELYIDNQIAKQTNHLGKKILVVDDMVDSGHTMVGVLKNLQLTYNPEALHTAVIWKNACSVYNPDFYVLYSPDNEWIVQPFEVFDEHC